ncbi:MAG: BTAD domain-containing putative transcriptional regulator [Rhizobiaceae bacterium]
MQIEVNVLGNFDARAVGAERLKFPTTKSRALFAYLVLAGDQPQSREKLSALLWGEVSESRSRANLRQALTRIRQALPDASGGCLGSIDGSIFIKRDFVTSDAFEFNRLIDSGTVRALEEATALYRGDLLDGFSYTDEGFEQWLGGERDAYRNRALGCFEQLLSHYYATGASTRGIDICNKILAIDPYRESVHRALMSFYADQDRRGAALGQFEECRALLAAELGIDPEPDTITLYEAIRDLSTQTAFVDDPVLSRPASTDERKIQTSHFVTNLVERSPWRGANWSKPSVAVLPFTCLEGDDHEGYLRDGLIEDLITDLARFRELHVTARNSSFAYRDEKLGPDKIGQELGVRYLVRGSLQTDGERLRVTAQLIEVKSGRHLWADRYDEPMAGAEALRNLLARQIVSALVGRIEHHQLEGTINRKPGNWKAYECWLRGIDLLRKVNWENVDAAKACFYRALKIDADFARAYVGLAMAQYKAWSCLNWTTWWKLDDATLDYARKALELDDEDHYVHSILGSVLVAAGKTEQGRYHLIKAERLNPSDARNLASSSIAFSLLGEAEKAIGMAELAVRLDPFHPDWYMTSLGMAYYVARDYERAIAALEVAPDGICDSRAYLAAAHAQGGNQSAARRHVSEFIRTSCERIGGDPKADIDNYVASIIGKSPFVRAEDTMHFREGLRLAGLPVPIQDASN